MWGWTFGLGLSQATRDGAEKSRLDTERTLSHVAQKKPTTNKIAGKTSRSGKIATLPASKKAKLAKSAKIAAAAPVIREAKGKASKPPRHAGRETDSAYRDAQPLPTPIPTDVKPAKNLLGMKTAELEYYRSLLLAKRRELVGDVSQMEHEALERGGSSNLSNLPLHMADMGTDNYEQEFTLGLMENDRVLLREINQALAKIQDGTFGICEGTGKAISKSRLEAQPWARFSIEHARKLEKRLGK